MNKRNVIISLDGPLPAFKYPTNLEIYPITPDAGPVDVQIDMALLDITCGGIESPINLVFVGGGDSGRKLAAEYNGHFAPTVDNLDPAAVWL